LTRRLALLAWPLVAAVALSLPAPARASHSQFTLFQATRELRSPDPAVRAATLDEISGLGVRWLRVVLYWHDVAPSPDSRHVPRFDETDPAAYPGWATYDRIIGDARARGLHVLLTVSGPVPRWATHSRRDSVTRPSPTRFRRFMTAVGRRYRRQVSYWSIWNEPNHPQFLAPQYRHRRPYSPRLYRRLYVAGRAGLARSGNRHDRVLMGETAPRGNSHVVFPLAFVRGALCLNSHYRRRRGCHALKVDGWAHHPYTTALGPWFVSRHRDDVTIGSLSRLTRALDKARRAHAVRHRVNLYLTEFGVQSAPDPIAGVSTTRQAEYRSIGEWIAYRNRRVRAFSQYLMRDDLPRPGRRAIERFRGFESGLRHSEGARKPAYGGFRLPMIARRRSRHRTYLWGLVRPARGRTSVTIEYRNRGSSRWHRLKHDRTDRRGYWSTNTRYRRGRSYRVRWRAPGGHRYAGARTRVYRR
jgi:hypothetical protein